LLLRVTKDMSVALAASFLEEADAAAADKTALLAKNADGGRRRHDGQGLGEQLGQLDLGGGGHVEDASGRGTVLLSVALGADCRRRWVALATEGALVGVATGKAERLCCGEEP
jgi:hypothetical protein